MSTYRVVAYDILTDLKQTFDDRDISLRSVVYHVQVAANNLRATLLKKGGNQGRFMSTFSGLNAVTDTVTGLPKLTIPHQVYMGENEAGIANLSYQLKPEDDCCDPPVFMQVEFQPTTINEGKRLYWNEYTKPSAKNPYFYRVGDDLFFLGVTCQTINPLIATLYTSLDPADVCDLDADIGLPEEYIESLKYNVLQLERFVANIPDERKNDGTDSQYESIGSKDLGLNQQQQAQKQSQQQAQQ